MRNGSSYTEIRTLPWQERSRPPHLSSVASPAHTTDKSRAENDITDTATTKAPPCIPNEIQRSTSSNAYQYDTASDYGLGAQWHEPSAFLVVRLARRLQGTVLMSRRTVC